MNTRFTALLLLLVFIAPVTYQELHVLHHRTTQDCYYHYAGISVFPENSESCPVCEYEFITCNVPEIFQPLAFTTIIVVPFHENPVNVHLSFSGNNISLRAPPVM